MKLKQLTHINCLVIFFSIAFYFPAQAQKKTAEPTKVQPVAIIPIEIVDNLLFLPVSINGSRPLQFILDGGSSVFVIDPVVIRELSLRTEGNGTIKGAGEGRVKVTYADSINYNLGPTKIDVPKSTVIDLSKAVPGHECAGLIGYELFERYVVEINYQDKTVKLFDPQTYKYTGHGSVLPLTISTKRAFVKATVKVAGPTSEIHSYLIDTGSSDSVDDNLIAQSTEPTTDATGGVGVGQTFNVKIGYIESFQFGKYTTKHIKGVSGAELIGNIFLHDYLLTFDYSRLQLMVEKQ
jgi:hypothetical protein